MLESGLLAQNVAAATIVVPTGQLLWTLFPAGNVQPLAALTAAGAVKAAITGNAASDVKPTRLMTARRDNPAKCI